MKDLSSTGFEDILIVDDTPANLRLLSQMLTSHGYKVRAVTNGSRALESVQTLPPDLILLDIRMPVLNGYEVCERLKAEEETREIPIIFISALDDIQDKVRAFKTGGVDYITKPFQIEEILARIQTHLALRKLQVQLEAANKRFEHELLVAGRMQKSFLPRKMQDLCGWQIAFKLQPARETSGDFYDIFHLPGNRLGILIADVVDKGVGAALFMALSWTLIRTYSAQFPESPETVLQAANQRILTDSGVRQFVTLFYGVLGLDNGTLIYSNAGHNPPLLVTGDNLKNIQKLTRTGRPLGIFVDETWQRKSAQINPGDLFFLYTDGITETHNEAGEPFGEAGLISSIQANSGESVEKIKDRIISEVCEFAGPCRPDDDIAIIVIKREDNTT